MISAAVANCGRTKSHEIRGQSTRGYGSLHTSANVQSDAYLESSPKFVRTLGDDKVVVAFKRVSLDVSTLLYQSAVTRSLRTFSFFIMDGKLETFIKIWSFLLPFSNSTLIMPYLELYCNFVCQNKPFRLND